MAPLYVYYMCVCLCVLSCVLRRSAEDDLALEFVDVNLKENTVTIRGSVFKRKLPVRVWCMIIFDVVM
jgi:hypothetical protein